MKIVIDMNLSPDWVKVLENAGLEAVHWSTVGDMRASESPIAIACFFAGHFLARLAAFQCSFLVVFIGETL